ncbi:MAG: OmpH family outer membrane protein [Muribaculaceae bacterium]|nr:OmpH family outer membrane protein [Muribaculaceae bacterium]
MIKKILLAIMIAVPMCAMAQTKIGVISADSVFQVMPETAQAQAQLQEKSKMYDGEIKKLQEELQKKYTEYQALEKDATTPASIKERRIQEIQELDTKYQQFIQTAERDIQQQQQQLLAPIREKIMIAIKAVGKENKFTAIFPEGSAIYTGEDVIDVTPLVKTKLGLK